MTLDPKKEFGDLFTRGVGDFIDPDGAFLKKLKEDPKKIVIKFGVDPTRPDIHIGHAVILWKLREFQEMGCKVIFLVGDLTSQIGDPTGKSKIRPELSQQQIEVNMKTYLDQVGKILHVERDAQGAILDTPTFSWIRNSDWFVSINDILGAEESYLVVNDQKIGPLPGDDILVKANQWVHSRMQRRTIKNYSFINILALLRRISFGRLIERDMFQNRIKAGEPVFMHEMLYPIIQGIDSDAISNVYGSCDMEVGGTDQHFNMLMGRDVMELANKQPQAVMSFNLLEGLDGKEKMSKSLDNYIGITDAPTDMFGKTMSVPDGLIIKYFSLCTDVSEDDLLEMEFAMQNGTNPMQYKKRLARELVARYHGEDAAIAAQADWEKTFSDGGLPDEIQKLTTREDHPLVDLLLAHGIVSSKSDFRRLVESGAISMLKPSEAKITDVAAIAHPGVYKIGKMRFVELVL